MLAKSGWLRGFLGRFWRFSVDAPKPRRPGICYLRNRSAPGVPSAGAGRLRKNACRTCAPKRAVSDAGILALTAPRQLRLRATVRMLVNTTGTRCAHPLRRRAYLGCVANTTGTLTEPAPAARTQARPPDTCTTPPSCRSAPAQRCAPGRNR